MIRISTIRSKVGARLGMAAGSFDVVTSVTEAKETALRTVCTGKPEHEHGPAAVSQLYRCPVADCAQEGKITDFSKAKEPSKNTFVVVPAAELENLQVSDTIKNQMVFAIYPRDQVEVHVVPHGKPYYLKPTDATSAEPYALFKRIVEQVEGSKVIMAIWSAKGAPVLWRLYVLNGVLAVQPYCWPNQLDAAPEVPNIDVSKYDVMIPSFIDAVSADFKPEDFRDERADALQAFVATQTAVEGVSADGDITSPQTHAVDLMAALAATVATKAPAKKAPRKRAARKAS